MAEQKNYLDPKETWKCHNTPLDMSVALGGHLCSCPVCSELYPSEEGGEG